MSEHEESEMLRGVREYKAELAAAAETKSSMPSDARRIVIVCAKQCGVSADDVMPSPATLHAKRVAALTWWFLMRAGYRSPRIAEWFGGMHPSSVRQGACTIHARSQMEFKWMTLFADCKLALRLPLIPPHVPGVPLDVAMGDDEMVAF